MSRAAIVTPLALVAAIAIAMELPRRAAAQDARASSSMPAGAMAMERAGSMDANMSRHMRLTSMRVATHADSARARALVAGIRAAIAKYGDTTVAVADGYRMFLPQVKEQQVYHFTNWRNALAEVFRFDPTRPTSLLYKRAPDGTLRLVGAMYTAPRRWSAARLDERIPLSIARWHMHVNWCLPARGDRERWLERRGGEPVFGPESPIDTRDACEAVGGDFHPAIFGWMVHANVFAGDDLREIFGGDHQLPDTR